MIKKPNKLQLVQAIMAEDKRKHKVTCAVSQVEHILNMCEIGYEIHISLNFPFKFEGIILILFSIKLPSFINLDHIVSVILTSKMI